jgi:hypothetical protein
VVTAVGVAAAVGSLAAATLLRVTAEDRRLADSYRQAVRAGTGR